MFLEEGWTLGDEGSVGGLAGSTVSHYRIESLIGKGGMGEVYLASDLKLRRKVAIKALPESLAEEASARARFLRECRLACKVVHPYVATVFDVIEHAERPLIVMERIEGSRLDQWVRAASPKPESLAALGLEIAEALAAIHRAGIVHRDLKPGNVMVTPDGHVKVTDFGVSLPVPGLPDDLSTVAAEEAEPVTRTGMGVGTVAYMSPEQIRGERLDGRSDLFSLGIVLYEAVTGEHPFRRESLLGTASAILHDPPSGGREHPTLTGSGPFRDVILRLLQKNPALRYGSAEDLATDLRAVLRGEGISPAPRPPVPWKRVAAAGAGLVVLAAAAAYVVSKVVSPGGDGGSPFRADRPGVLVMPFEPTTDEAAAERRGAMLASLLRAELTGCPGVRVIGSSRTEDFLEQWEGGSQDERQRKELAQIAAVRYLVSGWYDSTQGGFRLSVDVYDQARPDRPIAFVIDAGSLDTLVDRVLASLRAEVSAEHFAPDGAASRLGSTSEAALLAAERARVAFDRGDYATATREYQAAVDDDPTFIVAKIQLATVLYGSGFVARAVEAIEDANALVARRGSPLPDRVSLSLAAVRAQVREEREREIDARRRLVEAYPDDPEERGNLAAALHRANRNEEALASIDEAIARRPSDRRFRLLRSTLLVRLGRGAEARAELERVRAIAPDSASRRIAAETAFAYGRVEREERNWAAARASFEQARTAAAESGEVGIAALALQDVGEVLLREGRHTEAVPFLERASRELESLGNLRADAVVLDTLGATLFQIGRYAEAERYLRQAMTQSEATEGLAPRPNVYLNLASLLSYTGRFEESLDLAARAEGFAKRLEDTKRVAGARLQQGVSLAALGRFRESVKAYRAVLDALGPEGVDERVGWAWGGVSEGERILGSLGSAIVAADRAIEIHEATKQPLNLAYAYYGRARLRVSIGDYEGAESDLSAVRKRIGPRGTYPDLDARIDLESGNRALARGDRRTAIAHLTAASNAPASLDLTGFALASLATALCEDGRSVEGLRAAEKVAGPGFGFAERMSARLAAARCSLAAGKTEETVTNAGSVAAEAARTEMAWEQVESVGLLLAAGVAPAAVPAEVERAARILAGMRSSLDGAGAREAFDKKVRADGAAKWVVALEASRSER